MNIPPLRKTEKSLSIFFVIAILFGSCVDFFDIAQGTGVWFAGFALTWAVIFIGYCLFCLTILWAVVYVILHDRVYASIVNKALAYRSKIGNFRWLLALLLAVFPLWLFQFTVWGIVFQGIFIRFFIWILSVFFVVVLVSRENEFLSWERFLATLVLTAGVFSVAASLRFVSGYPFALGWSEGNRLWDYSIMFGRGRYDYPPDKDIFVLLESGRQFVGGILFLIPGVTIKAVRAWVGLLDILPYLLLGLALFRSMSKEKLLWVLLSLWVYLFLQQGPIHPPLIISAILVVLAWRSSLWIAIPLILISGYFTNISRFTWIFAPAIWIALLELTDALPGMNGKVSKNTWVRVSTLFGFGLFGGVLLPQIIKFQQTDASAGGISFGGTQISLENLPEVIAEQALLWYRLFPNSTYGPGILLGLLMATGPLLFLLYYLIQKKYWAINVWQKSFVALPLLAFLAIGLVISTKIGGGGDLHNMDMFLISLVFSAAVAWIHGGRQWLEVAARQAPIWLRMIVVAVLILPALVPLREMRSFSFDEQASWLLGLTDAPNERALDMYPSQAVVDDSLEAIQDEIDRSIDTGEILFIDQRQLLTFNFVSGVPLVPDYDKKVLIERALASNLDYFSRFYDDLENKRFSLIVTQPLNTPRKGSDDQFGEENNAWVKWVADPLLCYYEIQQTLSDVNVQLLIPRSGDLDCSKELP